MKKLVFFFPWPQVSGGPYFLARLANDVAKAGLYDVYYTDYPGGLCNALLTEKSIKVLKYRNEGKDFPIFPDEPVVLVMAEYWAHMVPKAHPDTRIVFFNWHNECVPVLQRDWCATDEFIASFLQLASDTASVFFCDKTHWMAQVKYGVDFPEEYVPITIPPRIHRAMVKRVKPNERNIAVLGRLVQDKIYAVLDLMNNIAKLRDGVRTKVYIIGEGDFENLLFDSHYPDNIQLIRCGTMEMKDILPLLSRKVDILFAMGTSVLDGASIALPSVVMPNAMEPFECNEYPYLYESKGYALGWYPEQIGELGLTTHTVEEIFDEIYNEDKKEEIGRRCFDYYMENHSSNLDFFLRAIDASTLTYRMYCDFLRSTRNWKNIKWQIKHRFETIRGTPIRRLSLFGFPLFTLTSTNWYHYNVFLCCIPLLRIKHVDKLYSIHLLLAVWLYRAARAALRRIWVRLRPPMKDEE